MKIYGVFHNDTLVFSSVVAYAIFEKLDFAESFMREMRENYPGEAYSVRAIELNADVAHVSVEETRK